VRDIVAAGFDNVAIGMETVNAAQARDSKKPYTPEQMARALVECDAAGVVVKAFYIVGFPRDTVASVCRDLVHFGKLGLAARPNNLKLYPGTDVATDYQKAGWIGADYDWRLSTFWTPTTPGLRYEQIKKLKTVLGGIGFAADTFGIRVFGDTGAQALAKLRAHKYQAEVTVGADGVWDALTITGNMFRPTPYRHMAEALVLASGANGCESTVYGQGVGTVRVVRTLMPKNEVQAGIVAALQEVKP